MILSKHARKVARSARQARAAQARAGVFAVGESLYEPVTARWAVVTAVRPGRYELLVDDTEFRQYTRAHVEQWFVRRKRGEAYP